MRILKRTFEDEAGVEILEAALVLPILFTLLLGIVWFGRAFNIYSTITQAAQQGAISAARATCATCGNANTNAAVDNAITSVLQSSNLPPSQIQASPNPGLAACASPPGGGCTAVNKIWVCRNVQLNPSGVATQPQQCGSVVSFQYPFEAYLPFTSLNLRQVVMSAQAQSRMEN